MAYAMKISKPGIDVLTASDKDLIFTSDRNCLKEKMSGLVDTDSSGNVTINHGLGYVPSFFIFMADYTTQTMWYTWDNANTYADTSNIYVQGALGGIKSKVFYEIFIDQV